MSVPHSGTRSLVDYLGLDARRQGVGDAQWYHFGRLDEAVWKLKPHTHIPVRKPMDVARSWAQRNKAGDPLGNLLKSYGLMFQWIDENPQLCTFYLMESLPRLRGTNEHKGAPERNGRITRYQETVMRMVVEPRREFFSQFYEDLA